MHSKSYRLDRFINQHTQHSKSDTRMLIAQGRILIDGKPADSIQQAVTQFTKVELDGACLQNQQAIYIILNKPKGVVSATTDANHKTVLDLINASKTPNKNELHIVGRLDYNTTGLVLLTNDGQWSRRISLPENKLVKTYRVRTEKPINEEYIESFQQGIYFDFEGITTQPAELEITSVYSATLKITEGKYHQVKRMFGHFQNEVIELHRESVGNLTLGNLKLGKYRPLTPEEIEGIF